MEVEIRYHTKEERDRVVNHVNAMISGPPSVDKVKVEVAYFDETPAWKQTEEGWKYIEHVRKIAESLGIPFEERKRGGLSDANHLSEVCSIIMDGMGPFGQYAHGEKEYMTIDSVEPCIRLFEGVLDDLAENKK